MNLPRPVTDFLEFLPHRAPFIWVDEITALTEMGGRCEVTLEATGLYMDKDGLRPSSLIEFMAQSFGYIRAAQLSSSHIPHRAPVARAFLVAVQDAVFTRTDTPVPSGSRLSIEITDIREFGPFTAYQAAVYHPSGHRLVSANLKIFSD